MPCSAIAHSLQLPEGDLLAICKSYLRHKYQASLLSLDSKRLGFTRAERKKSSGNLLPSACYNPYNGQQSEMD